MPEDAQDLTLLDAIEEVLGARTPVVGGHDAHEFAKAGLKRRFVHPTGEPRCQALADGIGKPARTGVIVEGAEREKRG